MALGNAGEIVKVKLGFTRNVLFSHGLAVRYSKSNRALVGEKKAEIKAKANREAKVFEDLLQEVPYLKILSYKFLREKLVFLHSLEEPLIMS